VNLIVNPDIEDVPTGQGVAITVEASGQNLRFEWSAARGKLTTSDQPAVFYTAPDTTGVDTITVKVSSSNGTTIRNKSFNIVAALTPTSADTLPAASTPDTVAATSLRTPEPIPTPSPGDFEQSTEGWGEHPQGDVLHPGRAVSNYCDNQAPIRHTGHCSLRFDPSAIQENNAYLTLYKNVQNTTITIYLFVPPGAQTCAPDCSTAKIMIWDNAGESHESEPIRLIPGDSGEWLSISWDVHEMRWPSPWPEFGVHFYLPHEYRGPVYIDAVRVEQ
jgi:hypothetical protein